SCCRNFGEPDVEDSVEVCATEVSVTPSAGNHESGSSKVKVHNIVDYTWEERFHTGQLLAVHMGGVLIAYGIKAINKTVGVVRVVNRKTDERALIKGMEGAVQDIAFAHIPKEVILACVDHNGNLFVYRVIEDCKFRLTCELQLHILPDDEYVPQTGDFYRVIWCPFIPELPDEIEEEDVQEAAEDVAWLLALSRGKKMELWNIKMVTKRHSTGPVKPGMVKMGYLEINEHQKPIVDAAFAPDGTAIATASLDGEIKFFQVYMQNGKKPRCLHQWQPHGGEPLSSLFFLDNHKNYNPDIQFWKFAITGAKNNSELKVWSCESWTCLQTLAFKVRPDRPINLNASLDLASGYLLLSDFHHKILYVLQLYTNNSETSAAIISISEFLLPYPILSFGIVDAGIQRFKSDNLEEICNDENDEESVLGILVRMYLVQPKSLQDCQIAFIPPKPGSFDKSTIKYQVDETAHVNGDLSASNPNLQELPANHSSLHLNLMTPDAFNSPVKHETSASSLIKAHTDETSYSNTTTLVASPHSEETENNLLTGVDGNVTAVFGFASGGSSPSREVQEILGETSCFYKETDDIPPEQEQVDMPSPKEKTVWPEIPMLRATEVRKNEEQTQMRRSVNQAEASGGGDAEVWKTTQRLETSVSSMIHITNSLLQAFEEQAAEVKQLREEIRQQNMLREIEKIISHNSQQQMTILEKILASKENKHQQEALASAVSQSVINFLNSKVFESVNKEISSTVVPAVNNQIESLKHQIHVEIDQKLSATDHLLKENITKLVHSKSVMDVLSAATVSSLTPVISQCYKEYFTNVALPSFEKSCSTMFNQINEIFSKGSKEFVTALDAQSQRVAEKNREQSVQLQGLSDVLKNCTMQMNNELKKSVAGIEKQVMDAVTSALTLQQAALEGSMFAAVRSRSVTPAPHIMDTKIQQSQILQLVTQGQINTAFQQALSASDLNLVVFVCEKVNPQQLFSQSPCPLQQHVLLSLVQQLSADMNNHTDIKHKYLEEALMNLDIKNAMTREHIPVVLNNLQRQLQAYIANNPNNRITRSIKLLLLASQAMLNDCR
ncbi:enhancer of mRNA-decapping protein 4-like, partial [Homalodisca vitripennis]|uniref:enhancer of mRNA-decapping protein 4-like n=1 Tax=Homalodisca vitripennis TaxID=197043 RepID=UPI001EEBAA33